MPVPTLEERITTVERVTRRVDEDVQVILGLVRGLADGQATLRRDMLAVKNQQAWLTSRVTDMKLDVDDLRSDMVATRADMVEVKADVGALKADMVEVKGMLATLVRRLIPEQAQPTD
jgi:hypothetical protein